MEEVCAGWIWRQSFGVFGTAEVVSYALLQLRQASMGNRACSRNTIMASVVDVGIV